MFTVYPTSIFTQILNCFLWRQNLSEILFIFNVENSFAETLAIAQKHCKVYIIDTLKINPNANIP
jgi:hypothetical protein